MSDLPPELAKFAEHIAKREAAEALILSTLIADACEHGDSLYNAEHRLVALMPKSKQTEALSTFDAVINRYRRKVEDEAWQHALMPKATT